MPNFLKESMKQNWNFQRAGGGEAKSKISPMRGILDIFWNNSFVTVSPGNYVCFFTRLKSDKIHNFPIEYFCFPF